MAQISLEGDRNLDKEIRMGYDIHTRKFVIVNWQKLCAPLMEEGLDLFPVSRINGVVSLKFCWLFTFSDDLWARFLCVSLLQNVFHMGIYKKIFSLAGLQEEFPTGFGELWMGFRVWYWVS